MTLTQDISSIKLQYRELFGMAHEALQDLFRRLQKNYSCVHCDQPPAKVDERLDEGCGYRDWQKQVIVALEQEVGRDLYESLQTINAQKDCQGACHMCGVCCNMASSEFDYETLLQKAQAGDWFASQFTSVFIPYDSVEAAREKFPELVGEMLEQAGESVYFYHCPYLSQDNRCSIYNDPKRPEICAQYPQTPLTLMYKNCGYQPWKTAQLPKTLMAHATLELCHFYVNRIYQHLQADSNVNNLHNQTP